MIQFHVGETILPFRNILCLQEHWLWHYEQQDTAKFIKDYNFTIRSSDCNFPKTHHVRKGHCGLSAMLTVLLSVHCRFSVRSIGDDWGARLFPP
jgi:hypothetical protein